MHFDLNIGFTVSAALALLCIFYHLLFLSGYKNREVTRSFGGLLIIGAIEVLAEMCSLILFQTPQNYPIECLYLVIVVQAVMRCFFPFALLAFTLNLCNKFTHLGSFLLVLACLPLVVALITALASPWTHGFFSIDPVEHTVQISAFANISFVYTAFYAIFSVVVALSYRSMLRRRDFVLVMEFTVITISMTVAECVFPSLAVDGLGVVLAGLVMLLSMNSSFSPTDSLTGAYEASVFREDAQRLIDAHRSFEVVLVVVHFPERLSQLFSTSVTDKSLVLSINAFFEAVGGRRVYRLAPSLFVSIVYSRRERQHALARLGEFFESRHEVDAVTLSLDTSRGFLTIDEPPTSADELQHFVEFAADRYAEQGMGRHPLLTFDSEQLTRSYRRQALVRRCIKEALDQDMFRVYLQPLWSLSQERFVGAEALSRLVHTTEGPISPGEFIPIAEEEGYIGEIGRRQFKRLCTFVEKHGDRMQELGICSIKVNVSAVEVMDPDYPAFVRQTMVEHHLEPSMFQFEITETVATSLDEVTLRFLDDLSSGGSKLCMDDFGSGFANLAMICSLPFDVVKIDSSLLQGVESDPKAALLYRGILSTMHNLGLETVCEGVETAREVELLSQWHADVIQGFYYARPMPIDSLLEGSWL